MPILISDKLSVIVVLNAKCLASSRLHPNDMLMHFANIGRTPPQYGDAAVVANAIMNAGIEFDVGDLYFNAFK